MQAHTHTHTDTHTQARMHEGLVNDFTGFHWLLAVSLPASSQCEREIEADNADNADNAVVAVAGAVALLLLLLLFLRFLSFFCLSIVM